MWRISACLSDETRRDKIRWSGRCESRTCVRHGSHCGAFQWPWRRLSGSAGLACAAAAVTAVLGRRHRPPLLLLRPPLLVVVLRLLPVAVFPAFCCHRRRFSFILRQLVRLLRRPRSLVDAGFVDVDSTGASISSRCLTAMSRTSTVPASSVKIFVSGTNLRSTKSIINSAALPSRVVVLVLELSALVVLPQVPASNKLRFFGFRCINDHGLSDTARHRRLHAARRPPRLQATAWSS